MQKKERRKNLTYKIASISAALFLVITIVVLQSQINDLKEEKEILASNLSNYEDRVAELEYESTLSESEYIEKYAREVLGFHKSGEIIFKNNG